ncbi:hypothetical protein PFY12_07865 [Chryseobacterium camelliae]|uniref:DUF4402 domain-containing protein n=1 Tax=Chryseobacterium camelliae TaxID=1265445 RepID=A0ABY7QHF8_9FLAO|nr:hypothetical protein [Chryseobacterium camelliae]WBV58990.1 hypothetical protein PFY12_07865 [Chryseobacterium camelliae]
MKINTYFFSIKYLSIIAFIVINSLCKGQTIAVNGTDWSPSISPITEAGSDYAGTYESATNQILINVTIPGLLGLLRSETVQVHYESLPLWNNNLLLSVQRTNSGGGGGICIGCSLTGGTTYQTITTTTTNFFNANIPIGLGTKTFTDIPIQLKLSGVSVTIPSAAYNARIVFTITN